MNIISIIILFPHLNSEYFLYDSVVVVTSKLTVCNFIQDRQRQIRIETLNSLPAASIVVYCEQQKKLGNFKVANPLTSIIEFNRKAFLKRCHVKRCAIQKL